MNMKYLHNVVVLVIVLLLTIPIIAKAFGGGGMKGKNPEIIGAFFPQRAYLEAMEKRGFISTGLKPVYPDDFDCPKVESLFASPYRSDGSQRSDRFFEGLHGGMDIPQPKGTPLMAIADGEIIVKHGGSKGGIGGLGLWIRHSPEDTDTSKWIFIEYKHIDRLPDLAVGDRVQMGQIIAETGNTGTDAGGYYGYQGFYHLHMTAYWSDNPNFKFKRVLIPADGQWLDPIALLRGSPLDSHAVKDLPDEQKNVHIPFKTTDGRVFPEDTRIVWPYACSPK